MTVYKDIMYLSCFSFLLLNLLGWYWSAKLHKFELWKGDRKHLINDSWEFTCITLFNLKSLGGICIPILEKSKLRLEKYNFSRVWNQDSCLEMYVSICMAFPIVWVVFLISDKPHLHLNESLVGVSLNTSLLLYCFDEWEQVGATLKCNYKKSE